MEPALQDFPRPHGVLEAEQARHGGRVPCPQCDLTFREASNYHGDLPPHAPNCTPAQRIVYGVGDRDLAMEELEAQIRQAKAWANDCADQLARAQAERDDLLRTRAVVQTWVAQEGRAGLMTYDQAREIPRAMAARMQAMENELSQYRRLAELALERRFETRDPVVNWQIVNRLLTIAGIGGPPAPYESYTGVPHCAPATAVMGGANASA